jgi:hypothetical protein
MHFWIYDFKLAPLALVPWRLKNSENTNTEPHATCLQLSTGYVGACTYIALITEHDDMKMNSFPELVN